MTRYTFILLLDAHEISTKDAAVVPMIFCMLPNHLGDSMTTTLV